MSSAAEVYLWGTRIGAVLVRDGDNGVSSFQYDPDFARNAEGIIEPAPITMPVREAPYSFPGLPFEGFHGLPGLLADSLPDRYGTALMDAWFQSQGRSPVELDAVQRLCYIGTRGMGALEFEPAEPLAPGAGELTLSVEELSEIAALALNDREQLVTRFQSDNQAKQRAMQEILTVGTSAGGARAKALIAYNEKTGEIRSGQIQAPDGFTYWLLKFDGVSDATREAQLKAPTGYGSVEYAYSLMARDVGIEMSRCRVLEENSRRHFMTERFDRVGKDGRKVHMLTLGAMSHLDFNQAGAHSYEQAFDVARRIGVEKDGVEQLYRRMVFNIVTSNHDDHVKNISFLMDREGRWSLAPAYDVTYAYNPPGRWTREHQMSVNYKRSNFTLEDLNVAARNALLTRGSARRILEETADVVRRWPEYAEEAKVQESFVEAIGNDLILEVPSR